MPLKNEWSFNASMSFSSAVKTFDEPEPSLDWGSSLSSFSMRSLASKGTCSGMENYPARMLSNVSLSFAPLKGVLPVKSWKIMIPSDQRSEA
jgi:hypothetical protein